MLIYKITNNINNKVYIGQTTNSLNERIREYRNEYKYNPNSRPIIRAMNKYGFNNFNFEIIDKTDSKLELDELERKYIKEYNSLITQNGYNVELGGSGKGKHSKETRRKISEAQIGKLNHMFGKTGKLNKTSKKILELTSGKTYDSACEAARELKLGFSHICAVARGERGSTGGYVFRYLDENDTPIKIENSAKIKFLKVRNSILPEYLYLI